MDLLVFIRVACVDVFQCAADWRVERD